MLTNRIGYGVELELDYGRVVAPYPVIKNIFDNWMNQDCLSGLITEEIEVWYEGILLFFSDSDGNREVFDRVKWSEILV